MQVRSISDYLKLDDDINDPEERERLHARFAHVVVVECDYPECDVAMRWCWENFGPKDGECWSSNQYAACPIVLATEHLEVREAFGKQYEVKAYDRVAPHTHIGEWSIHWLGKTDYDHGFAEFYFRVEDHKDRFLQHIPNVDFGENYPWLRDGTIPPPSEPSRH